MQWLLTLFNFHPKPNHEEIAAKVDRIQQGTDRSSLAINDQRSKYHSDLLELHKQAKTVQREAQKMVRMTDVAARIAMATGGIT